MKDVIYKPNISSSKKYVLFIAFIFIIAIASHMRALRNYYVLDDFRLILGNDFICKKGNINVLFDLQQLSNPAQIKCGARPLTILSLIGDYALWKYNPFGYHLTNLILHGLNSAVIFILCVLLAKDRKFKFEFGIFTALAFALHPVVSETVNIASFRGDLLATFFYLGSVIFFIHATEPYSRIKRNIYYGSSFLCFMFALLSKEIALTLPLILLLYLLSFKEKGILKRDALILGFYCFAVIQFFIIFWIPRFTYLPNITIFPNIENNISPVSSISSYLNTILVSFLHNVLTLLFPIKLSIDYLLYVPTTIASIQNIAIIIILFAFLGIVYFIKDIFLRFGVSFFIITYIPVSNIIPLTNTVNDRYLYLPLVGFCIVLAVLIHGLPVLRLWNIISVRFIAGICIIFAYGIITINRNPVFTDSYSLYTEAAGRVPKNIRVRYNFAIANMINNNFIQAIDEFETVTRLNPIYQRGNIWYFMGICYQELGNFKMSKFYYTKSLLLNPTSDAISRYSSMLSKEGDDEGAGWLLKKGTEIYQDPYLFNDLGEYYARNKIYKNAIICFKKSLYLKSNYPDALRNLSDALEKSREKKR